MQYILIESKFLMYFLWLSAILVNCATTPVHSAIYLILTFIISSLWLFINGFILLGYIYVIIYVGAISVLFLFILMLLKIQNNVILDYNLGFWYKIHIVFLFILYYYFFKIFITEIFSNEYLLKNSIWPNFGTIYDTSFFNFDFNFFFSNLIEMQTLSFDLNKILGFYLYSENGQIVLVFGLLLFISMLLAIFLVKPPTNAKI